VLDDEDELAEENALISKILIEKEPLSVAELETVSYSTRLRDVYNDRWWTTDRPAYFIHYDRGLSSSKKGAQLFIQYGHRSDDFLVDNYGFCLDFGANPFSAYKFRVKMGSKVDSLSIDESLDALMPPATVYEDLSRLDD